MYYIIQLGLLCVDFIYLFIKLCPTKHKVTFLSRQSNNVNVDFQMIGDKLKKDDPSVEIVYLCKMLDKGIVNKIKYAFHMLEQMYHVATSEVIILDTYCIVASCLHHKKGLKIIQIWHALGSLKKFGYSILDKNEGSSLEMAKAMHMHENYDYVLSSSKQSSVHFAKAFNVSEDKMFVAPLPRVDLLKDEKYQGEIAEKIYTDYPQLREKKNVLYVPTFRKSDDLNFKKEVEKLVASFDYDKYKLIVKLHPVYTFPIADERVITDGKYTSLQFASVADIVITDYSAIVYEMAIMNKAIYYYVFDQKEYVDNRDFYSDYEELPGPKCHTLDELLDSIDSNKADMKDIKDFCDRYIDPSIENYTAHICKLVESLYH